MGRAWVRLERDVDETVRHPPQPRPPAVVRHHVAVVHVEHARRPGRAQVLSRLRDPVVDIAEALAPVHPRPGDARAEQRGDVSEGSDVIGGRRGGK